MIDRAQAVRLQEHNMPASQSVDGAEKSQCVLVFLPGSMQTIFDQSLGVIAQQVGAACNRVMKTTAYTSSPVEEINVTSKEKIQKCSIKHVDGCRKKIVVISANYVPILSKTLDSSSYVLRFLRLFGFVCGSIPLLARILKKKQQRGHSNLTRGNKVLVILTCSIVIITLFAAGITVAGLIKDLMKDLSLPFIPAALQGVVEPIKYIILGATLFSVCIVGFVPPTVMSAVLASGGEYYGLVRYVLKSDRSAEVQTCLNQAYTHITENYPSVPIHLLCFSFGCIVGFDYLFRCTGKERFNTQLIKSVCFIGFPYAIFNAGAPKYFANRQ
jgi:hypothetical protein